MNANPMPYIEGAMQSANNAMSMYDMSLKNFMNTFMQKLGDFLKLPNSDKINEIDWASIQSIFTTIGVTLIIVSIVSILLWLLRAVGLYVAAKNKGDKLAWLAFVPYGCLYTMGSIVSDTKIFGIKIHKAELLLPALVLSMCLPFVSFISSIIFALVYFAILYRIYQKLSPNFAIIFLIFSILLPILHPLFLFFNRNGNKKQNEQSKISEES